MKYKEMFKKWWFWLVIILSWMRSILSYGYFDPLIFIADFIGTFITYSIVFSIGFLIYLIILSIRQKRKNTN